MKNCSTEQNLNDFWKCSSLPWSRADILPFLLKSAGEVQRPTWNMARWTTQAASGAHHEDTSWSLHLAQSIVLSILYWEAEYTNNGQATSNNRTLPTTSAAISSEHSGPGLGPWVPASLLSLLQLRTNKGSQIYTPNQSHEVPCFSLARLHLPHANSLQQEYVWILPPLFFFKLLKKISCLPLNICQTWGMVAEFVAPASSVFKEKAVLHNLTNWKTDKEISIN